MPRNKVKRVKRTRARVQEIEAETEVETEAPETEAPETEIIPVQDILQLIEARVADQVGQLEVQRQLESEDEEFITAADLKAVIDEKEVAIAATLGGVDEEAMVEKMGLLEDKLKQEAQVEFAKVQSAVGSIAEEGRVKFGQVDESLSQAVSAGLSKIAEAETAVAKKAHEEVIKAKEDGKAFLAYQISEFKIEIEKMIDDKIAAALAKK